MDMVEWLLHSGWPSVTLRTRHTKLARLATELRKQRVSFSAFLTKKAQGALGDTNSQEVVSTGENLNVYLDEVGGVTWTVSREIRRYFDYPTAEHLTRLQYCAGRAVLNDLQR